MTTTFSFGGLDTAPVSITQRAMSAAFNQEEKERRQEAEYNIQAYYGQQEQFLQLINDDVEAVVLNLVKPIVHKRCSMLYSRPLIREFDGPAASVSLLQQIYDDNSIDALLSQADLYAELTGSSLIHPYPDEFLAGGTRLRLYDGTEFSCLGADEDPATADAIDLVRVVDRLIDPDLAGPRHLPEVERVLQHQIWTPTSVSFYEGSQLIGTQENPYGFLPFTNFMGEEVHDQYIGYPCATLVRKLNTQINTLLTHLCFMIKMQAGTPIVLSGFNSGESVVVHPGRALNIPAGAAADVLNLEPKLEETLAAIQYLESQLYMSSGVPKITVEGGDGDKTHISGSQLLVRWFPLMSLFNEKTTRYERYELQLANMILATRGMAPITALNIIWPSERILPFSPYDETLERDVKLNITSPLDEIRRRNPEMDEAEAKRELAGNRRVNEANTPEPMLPVTSNAKEVSANGASKGGDRP
jgi:hypothetical protein